MNEINELMKSRRTIHKYKPDLVPDELVQEALELALWAPNHRLTLPWKFVIVNETEREKILETHLNSQREKKEGLLTPAIEKIHREKIINPSHLILILQKLTGDAFQDQEDYASIAMGIQNISLSLWSHGVGTKWSSGALTRSSVIQEIINERDAGAVSLGFLWVGWPAEVPSPPPRNFNFGR